MRPGPTPQRIAFFRQFGAANLGNEATLRLMVDDLREGRALNYRKPPAAAGGRVRKDTEDRSADPASSRRGAER
jgi:hypothetical protein